MRDFNKIDVKLLKNKGVFSVPFPLDRKGTKRSLPTFFFLLFHRWKSRQKIFSDGKCHRTSPYPPTVGKAPTRSVRAAIPAS